MNEFKNNFKLAMKGLNYTDNLTLLNRDCIESGSFLCKICQDYNIKVLSSAVFDKRAQWALIFAGNDIIVFSLPRELQVTCEDGFRKLNPNFYQYFVVTLRLSWTVFDLVSFHC